VNVGATTALEFVPEPQVDDTELGLEHLIKERPRPLVEVPGGNVRAVPQLAAPDLHSSHGQKQDLSCQ
jgi:hypothetical protein